MSNVWITISSIATFLADLLTIIVSTIALYGIIKHGRKLSKLASAIISYSTRNALSELIDLASVVEKCDISTEEGKTLMRKALGDIKGRVQGNRFMPDGIKKEIVGDIVAFIGSGAADEHELHALSGKIRAQLKSLDSGMYLSEGATD